MQLPAIGRWGLFGAVAYGHSYVFFTSTVVFAMVTGSSDYAAITGEFGVWMVEHGAIMVAGGIAFGAATYRAGILPRWTGVGVIVGVIAVSAASGSSDLVRTAAEAVCAAAFIGMGISLVRRRGPLP